MFSFLRSNINVKDKLFQIENRDIIPTRTISSCGLTVIDYRNSNKRNIHSTFEQRSGVINDNLLLMH